MPAVGKLVVVGNVLFSTSSRQSRVRNNLCAKIGAHVCAGTVTDRVWTLQELSILHELHDPVAVVVYGLFDSSHRHGFW